MYLWNVNGGFPPALTLAADARLCSTQYTNDQIWQLSFGGGAPPAISLQTTYGLRARSMRLFPRFIRKDANVINPAEFFRQVQVKYTYPNSAGVVFQPFEDLKVEIDYRVVDSQVVAGRLRLINHSGLIENMRLNWVALLSTLGEGGQAMAAGPMGINTVLSGHTDGLAPVLFINGGASAAVGPFPALSLEIELIPGGERSFIWALASTPQMQQSYQLARDVTARRWDADQTRIELTNLSQLVEITTGDVEWDAALKLSQQIAAGLLVSGTEAQPETSLVLSRGPDQGYSSTGDGSDYPYQWSGQMLLDAYYLADLLLPGSAEILKGIVRNYLSVQEENGFIDLKPGAGWQRSRRLAMPMLATLAWKISEYCDDTQWMVPLYPGLLKFVQLWFSPQHDRDEDGFPEWDHPLQTGAAEMPMLDSWHSQAQGADITRLETPSLGAMLYRECLSLEKIARLAGDDENSAWMLERAETLRRAVQSSWDAETCTFRYRDFEEHHSLSGRLLVEFEANKSYRIRRTFRPAMRMQISLTSNSDQTHAIQITLVGKGIHGDIVEVIPPKLLSWANGQARATSQHTFTFLEKVVVQGLGGGDHGRLATLDTRLEDLTLLLPLWAGIAEPEQVRALIEQTLMPRYLQPFGIGMLPLDQMPPEPGGLACVHLPWNILVIEGLLHYGYQQLSADLLQRLMNGLLHSLRQSGSFRELYHAETAQALGERNHLRGLPPVGLFLKTLGISSLRNNEVILHGFNPFPWNVTVKYRGMSITRHAQDTVVTFSNGETITVAGEGPHRVTLS